MTDREQWRDRLAEDLRRGGEPWPGAPSPEEIADALLPVVAGIVADELDAAGDACNDDTPGWRVVQELRGRADRLRQP